ncbi:hypothetical protein [Mesoplasma photuris]|uniref:hypothetical protein n=1 Tax=Mesoplasma photuris TaxID=217731 RepID=UPI0004E27CF6|nr:hypothetical protein [Mesoplasma photuris]
MNTKTYTFTKYIATVASIFIFIAPLVAFLPYIKEETMTLETSQITSTIMAAVAALIMGAYIFLRLRLKVKNGFKNSKKEQIYFIVSLTLYTVATFTALLWTINANYVMNQDVLKITFYVFFPMIVVLVVSGAIFESLSRVGEQIDLYKKDYEKQQAIKQAKIAEIVKNNNKVSEETIDQIVETETFKGDAKKLLQKDDAKKIEKENGKYNPFMDEELDK